MFTLNKYYRYLYSYIALMIIRTLLVNHTLVINPFSGEHIITPNIRFQNFITYIRHNIKTIYFPLFINMLLDFQIKSPCNLITKI